MAKPLSKDEALLKMADLCARSEQCPYDIARKLQMRGLSPSDIHEIVDDLTRRRFLDVERFAAAYARDKLCFSGWGRLKIRAGLLARRVPDNVIRGALSEIDTDGYDGAVMRAARSKASRLDLNLYEDRVRLYKHLLSRGFESECANRAVRRLVAGESKQ